MPKEHFFRTMNFPGNFPILPSKVSFWGRLRIAFFIMFGVLNLQGTDITLINVRFTEDETKS